LLDANEAFTDVEDCIRFLERIRSIPLEIVEQPLPSALYEEAKYLKRYCPFPLFADEAITHDPDFDRIQECYDGINMKLMKTGGYRQGVEILREARRRGMRTMIGCMVETSLGISSALHLASLADYADLDSYLLLKDEPFGLLQEQNGILSYTDPEKIC
jgi:L-alanine-DL-glutamate epimerase-like enolase superfamily enzyme